MSDSFCEIKTRQLKKQKADWVEEYKTVQPQFSSTLDEVNRLRLQKQIKRLEQQIGKN